MENEIKVREYIRTEFGEIGKVFAIEENPKRYFYDEYGNNVIENSIVKHSSNLIDLIECGDYVNGHKVVNEVWGEDDNNLYFEIEGGFNKAKYIGENDIKEVVTKEMMESISYKVKQEEN